MEIPTHDMDTAAFWNLHLLPAHPVQAVRFLVSAFEL